MVVGFFYSEIYKLKSARGKGIQGEIHERPGWMLENVASQGSCPEPWCSSFLLEVSHVSKQLLCGLPQTLRLHPLRAKRLLHMSHP